MASLQELLDDAQINDDLEISFGDKGKFKVGDLRNQRKQMLSTATAKEAELKKNLDLVAKKQQELAELGDQAAKLIEQYKAGPVKGGEGEIDFDTDPIYGPLVTKKLKPIEEKLTAMETAGKALQSAMTDATRIFLSDRMERRWRDIPEVRRPKDKGWADYYKVAQEKKIVDSFGIPDPIEAFNREVEPIERQSLADENKKLLAQIDELKKGGGPRMPRPGASGVPKGISDKEAKPFTSADELVDAAFNDPLIQGIVGGQA